VQGAYPASGLACAPGFPPGAGQDKGVGGTLGGPPSLLCGVGEVAPVQFLQGVGVEDMGIGKYGVGSFSL
jgi:hypothetical protein